MGVREPENCRNRIIKYAIVWFLSDKEKGNGNSTLDILLPYLHDVRE